MTRHADAIVVMGVSASGKSVVGIELARRLGIRFVDADDLHPPANVAKMSQGVPLTDADRQPWLDLVGERLAQADDTGAVPDRHGQRQERAGVVVACSALKRAYRDRLRAHAPGVVFVHLTGSPELLSSRALARTGHFMPPELLASQLATLEPLGEDERGIVVDVGDDIAAVAARAAVWVVGAREADTVS